MSVEVTMRIGSIEDYQRVPDKVPRDPEGDAVFLPEPDLSLLNPLERDMAEFRRQSREYARRQELMRVQGWC
jgi:hypothetical protein